MQKSVFILKNEKRKKVNENIFSRVLLVKWSKTDNSSKVMP